MRQGYRPMVRDLILGGLVLGFAARGRAQLGMFSKEQRIDLTREWSGERFADGRPKVPDSVLEESICAAVEYSKAPIPFGVGIAGHVALSKEPVVIKDAYRVSACVLCG